MKNITIKEVSPLLEQAQSVVIKDTESLKKATEFLSKLNSNLDKVVESKETITKPLNEALKQARLKYKPIETILNDSIDLIREKMSVYATEIENERIKKENLIQKKLEEGKMTVTGALKKLDSLESVKDTVSTDSGSVSFRPVQKLKIIDESLIARKYLIVSESLILDDLKSGIKVEGCELEIIQVPVNRR